MDFVTLKKYLYPEPPKPEHYVRFLQLLLKGISVHAVEANEIELTRFRQEVSNIAEKLTVHSTVQEIEVALDFVMRAVTGYNSMAARIARAHLNELQTMLNMMSKTITFLSDSNKTGVKQLQSIEKNLQTASTIGDVRVLRGKLNDCLVQVRNESTRLRDESQSRIAELQAEVQRSEDRVRSAAKEPPADLPEVQQERIHAVPSGNALAVLRGREAATGMIAGSISQGRNVVVALFVIDRFSFIRRRYGSAISDEALLRVNQHLVEKLGAGALFKWGAPAFVAVWEADRPLQEIEQQMTAIAARRFVKTLEEDRRTILLPILCSCMVRRIADLDRVEDVVEALDDFVATKAD